MPAPSRPRPLTWREPRWAWAPEVKRDLSRFLSGRVRYGIEAAVLGALAVVFLTLHLAIPTFSVPVGLLVIAGLGVHCALLVPSAFVLLAPPVVRIDATGITRHFGGRVWHVARRDVSRVRVHELGEGQRVLTIDAPDAPAHVEPMPPVALTPKVTGARLRRALGPDVPVERAPLGTDVGAAAANRLGLLAGGGRN